MTNNPSAVHEISFHSIVDNLCNRLALLCHITPVLSDLQRLPVRHRISLKSAMVTFRVLQFQQPTYLHLSSQRMYRREHSALLQFCLYVFPHVKSQSQPPNHFYLLLQISGTHCQVICHPFQLFLLSAELSNITCSCLLTLTVMRNLVGSIPLNLSRFVIHRQLLPSHSSEIQCRPY